MICFQTKIVRTVAVLHEHRQDLDLLSSWIKKQHFEQAISGDRQVLIYVCSNPDSIMKRGLGVKQSKRLKGSLAYSLLGIIWFVVDYLLTEKAHVVQKVHDFS